MLQNAKPPDYVAGARAWANKQEQARVALAQRLTAAADVEAVRLDGSARRAKDLDLAAKAADGVDAKGASADGAKRDQFVRAFSELEKAHAARRAAGRDASSPMPDEERARATLQAMLDGAGTGANTATEADEKSRAAALDANAKIEEGDLEAAAKREAELNLDPAAAAQVANAAAEAKAAQQLEAREEQLEQQSRGDQPGDVAAAQKQLAADIAREEEQMGEGQGENTRTALQVIREARRRVKELPPRVDDFALAAEKQFAAHDTAGKAQAAAATAGPDHAEAARRAAETAKTSEQAAAKGRLESQARVPKSEMQRIAAELSDFAPETTPAVDILKQKLAPAIDASERHAEANDASAYRGDVKQVREATVATLRALDEAERAVLQGNAAMAAKQFAQQAADVLQQSPSDRAAAAQAQAQAAKALSQQRGQALQQASQGNLRASEHFRPVLVARGNVPAGQKTLGDAREWGRLEKREKGEETAPVHDEDPSGYRRMLEVYFRALGNAGANKEKK
jgi:hypothetical protein